ncbi:hypothetical protein [Actinomadura monticuli]|uniref:SCO6045-like C-terminal domain-containing protein n=1 Tax=Actinomadura monticuli TaxID=3097367 RepID=A0ABV4QFW6_9ACTN
MSGPFDPGLAAAQEALVLAMTSGGPLPDGFDAAAVGAAARGILLKRAGEAARAWPALAASYGPAWREAFTGWAAARPTRGSFRDGWDFARAHRGDLGAGAARELALAEVRWSYDGEAPPRPRALAVRRTPGGVAVLVRGYVRVFGRAANR